MFSSSVVGRFIGMFNVWIVVNVRIVMVIVVLVILIVVFSGMEME